MAQDDLKPSYRVLQKSEHFAVLIVSLPPMQRMHVDFLEHLLSEGFKVTGSEAVEKSDQFGFTVQLLCEVVK